MMFKEDRSVFDSLAKLYQFLNDKYQEELKKSSKNKKAKKYQDNIMSSEKQKKSNNAQVSVEDIHRLIEKNEKRQPKTKVKEFNINTMKLQTRKEKRNSNPPIDYNPIPFNFLSTKYKNEKIQLDPIDEENFLKEEENYSNALRENYELVKYLTNNRIKSDFFSIWTKNFYYSVFQKKSRKPNDFYFENSKNSPNKIKYQNNYISDENKNDEQPCFLFDSNESKSESEQEIKNISNYNLQAKVNDSKKKSNSDKALKQSKDEKDLYVDIVLSEYT